MTLNHRQPCDCGHCRRRSRAGIITIGRTTLNLMSLQVEVGPPRRERRVADDRVDALLYALEVMRLAR